MRRPIRTLIVLTLAAAAVRVSAALAKSPPPVADNAVGRTVNLPQSMTDPSGGRWMIYQQGWLQMQGNNPIYGQSAVLTLNGNQPNARGGGGNNRARLDEKTGELLFDFSNNGINITRRVLLDKKNGYVRYVDIFKNARPHDQTLNVQITTNLNFGVNAADLLPDPRNRDKNIAWVAQTDGPSCAVEVFASKNAKVSPAIDWQPGNNTVTAAYQLPIPTGKSAAILHIHALSATTDAGAAFVGAMKETKIVADLPLEIRKELVNFATGAGMAGDFEVLRGDTLDVVELRGNAGGGGDQYKGTLQLPSFTLQTFYGTVDLPADRVVGLINVGDFRPRPLLITTEGEIFGGHLLPPSTSGQNTAPDSSPRSPQHSALSTPPSIPLQLSSGQVTQIPLSQISRIGYRKRPGEPEEWTLSKPMVLLRTGDRVQVDLPARPVPVLTRYGRLSLDPKSISSLLLASEDHGVHEILLADGSQFAGLVDADTFDMTLASGAKQPVQFPASAITRIQFSPPKEPDDAAPTLNLTNGDKLVGQLAGQLKLDTSFDTITVNAPEIKHLTHPDPAALDVQVTLWDDSTLSGQLQQSDLSVQLNSGVTLSVPSALLADYTQPLPAPSPATAEKIKSLVAALGADDFKQREQAESDLLSMGPAILRPLRDLKPAQSPEAQQRIDSLIKQLEHKPDKSPTQQ